MTLPSYRISQWKKMYGLSERDVQAVVRYQRQGCAICGTDISDIVESRSGPEKGTGVIDHDHNTGFVRGILCTACNLSVGSLTTQMAWRVALYLEEPPALAAVGKKRGHGWRDARLVMIWKRAERSVLARARKFESRLTACIPQTENQLKDEASKMFEFGLSPRDVAKTLAIEENTANDMLKQWKTTERIARKHRRQVAREKVRRDNVGSK